MSFKPSIRHNEQCKVLSWKKDGGEESDDAFTEQVTAEYAGKYEVTVQLSELGEECISRMFFNIQISKPPCGNMPYLMLKCSSFLLSMFLTMLMLFDTDLPMEDLVDRVPKMKN